MQSRLSEGLDGGWMLPEVAAAQRTLVEQELHHPVAVEPFRYFMWAMDTIKPESGTRLLDVGCGVGHYGLLMKQRYPDVLYAGTDYSEAMIEQAQKLNPEGTFGVCDFAANAFGGSDIVLAAQVIEYQPDRYEALALLLAEAKHYVILHRIRLTADDAESHPLHEKTYCGHSGNTFLWNLKEFTRFVSDRAAVMTRELWADGKQATFVVEKA